MQPKEVSQVDTYALTFETRRATLSRFTPILPQGGQPKYTIESEFQVQIEQAGRRGIQNITIGGNVDAASLTEAFEKAEDVLKAAYEEFKAKTIKPKIDLAVHTTIPNLRGEAKKP